MGSSKQLPITVKMIDTFKAGEGCRKTAKIWKTKKTIRELLMGLLQKQDRTPLFWLQKPSKKM